MSMTAGPTVPFRIGSSTDFWPTVKVAEAGGAGSTGLSLTAPVAADGVIERCVQAMAVTAGQGQIEPATPVRQAAPLVVDASGLIAQVVRNTQEGIERAHGLALRTGQHAEGTVEIARLLPRQAFTVSVGACEGWGHDPGPLPYGRPHPAP